MFSALHLSVQRLECGKTALFYYTVPLPTFLRLISFTPTFNAPRFRKPRYRNVRPSRTLSRGLHKLLAKKNKCNVKKLRNSEKFWFVLLRKALGAG